MIKRQIHPTQGERLTKKMKLQRVSAKLNDTPFLRAPLSGKTSKIQPPPIYEGVGFNLRE